TPSRSSSIIRFTALPPPPPTPTTFMRAPGALSCSNSNSAMPGAFLAEDDSATQRWRGGSRRPERGRSPAGGPKRRLLRRAPAGPSKVEAARGRSQGAGGPSTARARRVTGCRGRRRVERGERPVMARKQQRKEGDHGDRSRDGAPLGVAGNGGLGGG